MVPLKKIRTRIIQHQRLSPLILFRNERSGKLVSPTAITAYARSTHLLRMPSSPARLSDQIAILQPLRENIMHSERTESTTQHRMLHGSETPDFLESAHEWRRIFAETWGTFLLVVVAAGAGVVGAQSSRSW